MLTENEKYCVKLDMGTDTIDGLCFINPQDPEGIYNLQELAKYAESYVVDRIALRVYEYESTNLTPSDITAMQSKLAEFERTQSIVYCKDCKMSQDGFFTSNRLYCGLSHSKMINVEPDDFCSYGKKKAGNT